MRRTEDGLEILAEELVLTAYRAWCAATGTPRDFEDLSYDEQARWLRATRWASLMLPSFDGKPASEAARLFMEEWAGDDPALRAQQAPYMTEWEACVRHLNIVLDSDELEDEADVRALEQSWAQWVRRRPRRLVTSSP